LAFIHTSPNCPDASNDVNADGRIDYQEALTATGPILIPLDSDLSEQQAGEALITTDSSGNLNYQQGASLEDLIQDLRGPDTDEDDQLGKLLPDQLLNLSNRVVLLTALNRFPLACGKLVK